MHRIGGRVGARPDNRDNAAAGRRSTTNSRRVHAAMLASLACRPPYRRMTIAPQAAAVPPETRDPRARRRLLRSRRGRRLSRRRPCASATTAGPRRSASTRSTRRSGSRHFGRFEPLPGSLPEPLALRYHGHQFRVYNPDIGDGRGFLFAQLRDGAGRLLDLGTKGSGQTPWSRFGDGRLTLKGGVREVLATEMLEALGVETSQDLLADRDRRGAAPRRRALAHPLGGAGPAQPRPYPHRHLPAPRLSRAMPRTWRGWSTIA